MTNGELAELLALEAEESGYPLKRALRRAGRAAFLWREEAADLVAQKRALTELAGIGPFLEKLIRKWLKDPPEATVRDDLRKNFFTWTEAEKVLREYGEWKVELRGDLQMHTEWSDGSGTVRAMAEGAVERRYGYIAITDHGKRLKIAGGISEEELAEQGREIAALNDELADKSFQILRSIELNLDTSGNGDMATASLDQLDIVLGAFHSSLRKTEDQTERYLAALQNPHLQILGHPRGRIYNYRLGLKADWPRVFAQAAKLDKAVEIDCYPDRQDLSFDLLQQARDSGVRISLGTDAHHPWQLGFIDFGLAAAAAANIPKERILNFMSAERLLDWVNSTRETGQGRRKGRKTARA